MKYFGLTSASTLVERGLRVGRLNAWHRQNYWQDAAPVMRQSLGALFYLHTIRHWRIFPYENN
jgi:hypothetical protein